MSMSSQKMENNIINVCKNKQYSIEKLEIFTKTNNERL